MSTKEKKVVSPQGKRASKSRRNKKVKKESRPQLVAKREGQGGIDSRVQSSNVGSPIAQLKVKLTDPTIDIRAYKGDRVIEHLALGMVLTAINRGWASQTRQADPGIIYAAYVYLVQSFYSAMQGTVPTLQSAPLWYWTTVQALLPTTTKFKTSAATYKWELPEGIQEQVPTPTEFLNGLTVSLGMPGPGDVNQFPILTTPVYTPASGEEAVKSMFEYTNGTGYGKMCPYTETSMVNDISAFSVAYPELGSSSGAPGGMATTIYSEKKIHCPLFAQFCEYQRGEYRGWSYAARGAGTPGYVLPRMLELSRPRDLTNQISPIFKFYDFDEFFEVLSLTMAYALERAQQFSGTVSVTPCPLTSQQVQILLRQTIVPSFANHMAQDLRQDSDNTLPIVPLSVGMNGVSITAQNVPMKLPMLLAENVRSVSRRVVQLPSGQLDFVPILGRKSDAQQLGNYTWTGGNVYTPAPEQEVPIDLISASSLISGSTYFLDLNGSELANYSLIWNEWITGLSNYLSPLTTPGQSPGPAIMSSLTLTRQVKFIEPEQQLANQTNQKLGRVASVKKFGSKVDIKLRQSKADPIPTGFGFSTFAGQAVTSSNQPLSAVWKYQRVMVLPVYYSYGSQLGGAIPWRQTFQIEPFRVASISTAEDLSQASPATLLSSHKEMALLDIKTELASVPEVVQDFEELNRMGEGGFFTSLAGMFTEDILGIKGGRAIAGAIGDITGL